MKMPRVLISVLNWNKYNDTINCIHSILSSDYTNYEIVIVDNDSANNSVDKIAEAFPKIQLIKSKENLGYAGGHKLSVTHALNDNADVIWILNNDCQVRSDTLTNLVDAYDRHGDAIYGSISLKSEEPDIINYGGGKQYEGEKQAFSYNIFEDQLLNDCKEELKEREVQTVEGSSLLIPLSIIKQHGFMDESYFMYGEETVYCYYLRTKKIPSIVVPSSIILHMGASSFSGASNIGFIASYYRRRNYIFFMMQFYGWNTAKVLELQGGWMAILKFMIRYKIGSKQFKADFKATYYTNLATVHAIWAIKGKTIDPGAYYVEH